MDTDLLFGQALGLTALWYVTGVELTDVQLTIGIDLHRGGRFACPGCGAGGCPAAAVPNAGGGT